MIWKSAARTILHRMGGLALLRSRHRRELGILMFHSFSPEVRDNLEAICAHITRHFEPVSLSAVVDALDGKKALPDNSIAVTVDDGYRNFLLHGHPIFRRNRIPVILYPVAGFCEGQIWLWPDQIEFALRHTLRTSLRVCLGDAAPLELSLTTPDERTAAIDRLTEILKEVRNDTRVGFLSKLGELSGVEIPSDPPCGYEAMNWDELRFVASEGVEVGCHTETHPILSRLRDPTELDKEIRGAKKHLEEKLGFEVRHFCYPNGRPVDIGAEAIHCVEDAGFASAVSCTWGLNNGDAERFQLHRIPFDSNIDLQYGQELMAGLHL